MTRFNIIVTVRNSKNWIKKCLDSLGIQKYPNWRGVVIDDNSTDITPVIIVKNLPGKMSVIQTHERKGALYNQVAGVKHLGCEDEDVIVIVDGDDWLPDNTVLDRLAKAYEDPNVWLTYGSYEIYPRGNMSDKTRMATEHDNPRNGPMIYRHLRTFKYFLWKNIKEESLIDPVTGKHFLHVTDSPVMRPMVEMAGLNHIHHIDDKMYVYNFTNPVSQNKKVLKLHNVQCGVVGKEEPYKLMSKEELIV